MTWKNTIKKKSGDEEDETLEFNNKIRDTRSADSYKTGDSHKESTLTDETKETLAKIEEQIREAFESIDHNLIASVIMPHGRTYKDKDALISDLVKDAINRIKSDKLYR